MHSGLHSSQTGDTPHQTVVCYKWCWHVCLCLCVFACVHNHTRVCVTVCAAAACLHSMRRRWSGFRSEGCEVAWWKLAHGGGEKSPDLPSSPQSSKDWTSNPPGLSQMFITGEKGKRTLVSCQENLLGFHPRCCHRKGSRFFFPSLQSPITNSAGWQRTHTLFRSTNQVLPCPTPIALSNPCCQVSFQSTSIKPSTELILELYSASHLHKSAKLTVHSFTPHHVTTQVRL